MYLGYVIISCDNFKHPEKTLLSMQIIKCSEGCLFLIDPLSPSYKLPVNIVLLPFKRSYTWSEVTQITNVFDMTINGKESLRM